MRNILATLAILLLASPAWGTWSETWKPDFSPSTPGTTGTTISRVTPGTSAFIDVPNTVLGNDDSPAIEFTSKEGTTVCVDTHLGQLAAGGTLIVNIYWAFTFATPDVTNDPGMVLVQNAGGTVALSSGAPCEVFSPGIYVFRINTAPGSEDAAIHARGN